MAFINGEITKQQGAVLLGCVSRTIERYRRAYRQRGKEGLVDHRQSNYHKLTEEDKEAIIAMKRRDLWRSARNIRDELRLWVHAEQIRRVLAGAHLMKQNITRVKPIQRFEAVCPNELWQCDIMGKIEFPKIGALYLIAGLTITVDFVCLGNGSGPRGR